MNSLPSPGRRFVIGVPFSWLLIFFLLPFLILVYISFVDMGNDINPFKPIWDSGTGLLKLKYENYWSIFRTGEGGRFSRRSTLRPICAPFGMRCARRCCVC
ncbi:hypothetical protein [Rhodoferax potami]|uniref:hypothetical protein n=1 Tax=Rhodoferax potami TaxID=3068338 RepID=UPI003D187309